MKYKITIAGFLIGILLTGCSSVFDRDKGSQSANVDADSGAIASPGASPVASGTGMTGDAAASAEPEASASASPSASPLNSKVYESNAIQPAQAPAGSGAGATKNSSSPAASPSGGALPEKKLQSLPSSQALPDPGIVKSNLDNSISSSMANAQNSLKNGQNSLSSQYADTLSSAQNSLKTAQNNISSEIANGINETNGSLAGQYESAGAQMKSTLDSARSSSDQIVTGGSLPSLSTANESESGLSLKSALGADPASGDPFAPLKTASASNDSFSRISFPDLSSLQSNTPPPAAPSAPAQPNTQPVAQGTYRGGSPAPQFSAVTMDGQTFDLSGARGRVVVLDFWRKTCGPCLKAMPRLAEIRGNFPQDKLVIMGMNTDETVSEAAGFLASHPHNWQNIHVLSQRTNILGTYGVRLLPTFVVIDQVGNVQYRGNDVNQVAVKVSELVSIPSISTPNNVAKASRRPLQ